MPEPSDTEASDSDDLSPFPEWETLREEIVPYVGERALFLLAFAVFDEADGFEGAAYFREALRRDGTDVDSPEVTESEGLLLRWGRLFARDAEGIPADVESEFERVFNPQLRSLLVRFAALSVATAATQREQ